MRFILLFLLVGIVPAVQAQSGNDPMLAAVDGGNLIVSIQGQVAKEIFDGMPESSKLVRNKKCDFSPDRIIKIKGGFICIFFTQANNLFSAYSCDIDISTKTGKALVRNPIDYCEREDP